MSEDRTPYGDNDIEAPAQHVIEYNITDAALATLADKHKDVDAYVNLDEAKAAAKECQQLRKSLEDKRKFLKADALAYGRQVDAKAKEILEKISAVEDPIKAQLTDIKEADERAEQKRLDQIQALIERIQAHANDRHDLTLEQLEERRTNLQAIVIDADTYQEELEHAIMYRDEADTKLRICIQAEKERLEEAETIRMAAEENQRKADELAERQRKMDEEDAERKARQDAEDAERQAVKDAEAEEIRKKEQAEREEQIAAEAAEAAAQAERDRIAAEEQADLDAQEAAALAALQAPDKDKLNAFADSLGELIKAKPVLQSDRGNDILLEAVSSLIGAARQLTHDIEEMK